MLKFYTCKDNLFKYYLNYKENFQSRKTVNVVVTRFITVFTSTVFRQSLQSVRSHRKVKTTLCGIFTIFPKAVESFI